MKTLTLLSLSLIFAFQTHAGNIIKAFQKSYDLEYNGDYTGAINSLKTVYEQNHYELNLRLAWLHYSNGQFTEATNYYKNAIALKPYSIEAKLGLVNPMAAMGEWDKIINCYNEILSIDAQNLTANYRLASIFYARKDYSKAVSYLEKMINLYPFDYNTMSLLAWTYLQKGNMSEAKSMFNKVLLYSPNDASAIEGLSLIK